jgi:hypothetical protein
MKRCRYYDLKANWRKVRRHLANPIVADTLVRDFNKFTYGRWEKPFKAGMLPYQFESCDWRCESPVARCAYTRYVKHAACHWLVNFSLELAQLVEPEREWRIIGSDDHSTVWDGDRLLFDFNFQALGITPNECFKAARHGPSSKLLKPGKHLRLYFADHYSHDN